MRGVGGLVGAWRGEDGDDLDECRCWTYEEVQQHDGRYDPEVQPADECFLGYMVDLERLRVVELACCLLYGLAVGVGRDLLVFRRRPLFRGHLVERAGRLRSAVESWRKELVGWIWVWNGVNACMF